MTSLQEGTKLLGQLRAANPRIKAEFVDLRQTASGGYVVGVETQVEPFTVIGWFERVELLIVRIDTMREPMQVYFRPLVEESDHESRQYPT